MIAQNMEELQKHSGWADIVKFIDGEIKYLEEKILGGQDPLNTEIEKIQYSEVHLMKYMRSMLKDIKGYPEHILKYSDPLTLIKRE